MKLKPCPFCGSTPKSFDGNLGWHVGCIDAHCYFQPECNFDIEKDAIKAWNTRHPKEKQTGKKAKISGVLLPTNLVGYETKTT